MGRSKVALMLGMAVIVAPAAWAVDAGTASSPVTVKPSGTPGTVVASQSESVAAIVIAVDQDKREVSLQGPNGRLENMHVDERVKNFAQIKVGDAVLVRFYRGLALTLQAPDSAAVAPQVEAVGTTAQPGEKPSAAAAAVIRGTVTIKSIDPKTRIVVLVGPEGREFRVKAGKDVKLNKVKVGDKIYAEYGEALAISVRPTTQPAKK